MQKQRMDQKWLLVFATLAVLVGIVLGALFLIAPIWQPGTPAAYTPALPQAETPAESAPQLVDINTAGVEELSTLPGIGEGLAGRIVRYREANGAFESVEALTEVSGIGEKKLEELRDYITVSEGVQP